MAKTKYWDINNILSKHCLYNLVYGERSNGKTYGVLQYALEQYFENGSELAIIRRMEEDFRGKRGASMFESLINNGVIKKLSKGKWNSIKYYSQRWYFQNVNSDKDETITDEKPFAYAFALSSMEHDKSTSYPRIRTIFFDECLTRGYYLPDEFILFTNVLSTIIRERDDVTIFMAGNTINKYCPYFAEMGLTNVKKQKQGTIDIYTYGDSDLCVAVEYADSPNKQKKSDKYFAFNNPKLHMITKGEWELDLYPHLPLKYLQKNIIYMYFIKFDNETLQCEIISAKDTETKRDVLFTYIHRKTTEIRDNDGLYMVYTNETSPLHNYRKNILKPTTDIERKILSFYAKDKVFYQDNDVGETIRNYMMTCSK